jgi:hypothetical protein
MKRAILLPIVLIPVVTTPVDVLVIAATLVIGALHHPGLVIVLFVIARLPLHLPAIVHPPETTSNLQLIPNTVLPLKRKPTMFPFRMMIVLSKASTMTLLSRPSCFEAVVNQKNRR